MSSEFGIFAEGEARSLVDRFVEAYRLNLIRVKFDEGELELFRKEMRNYELGVNRAEFPPRTLRRFQAAFPTGWWRMA